MLDMILLALLRLFLKGQITVPVHIQSEKVDFQIGYDPKNGHIDLKVNEGPAGRDK